MTATRWWVDRSATINGIFKGGGAKGLLYAGALEALDSCGYWFGAVAGSSAGAITAALVASGLTVDQIKDAVPEALGEIRRNYLFDLVGRPFILTNRLQRWLETRLADQVSRFALPRTIDGPVTFAELYSATGIELYVVSVDVARRQPLVFHHRVTPQLSVTSAVIASSAIPFAFRPGRLEVTRQDGRTETHRVMDGGVWANYPAFVFKDASFRAHHGLDPVPTGATTIGFILEHGDASESTPTNFASESTATGGDKGAGLRGWLRFAPLRIYLLTVVPLVLMVEAMWTTSHYGLLVLKDNIRDSDSLRPWWVYNIAGFFDGAFSHFGPALWVVFGGTAAIALLLMLIGATLIDSAIPSLRTLMAVGTDVPYWVGSDADDHVVRLSVPPSLKTLTFKPPPESVPGYVAAARVEALNALTTILPQRET